MSFFPLTQMGDRLTELLQQAAEWHESRPRPMSESRSRDRLRKTGD